MEKEKEGLCKVEHRSEWMVYDQTEQVAGTKLIGPVCQVEDLVIILKVTEIH